MASLTASSSCSSRFVLLLLLLVVVASLGPHQATAFTTSSSRPSSILTLQKRHSPLVSFASTKTTDISSSSSSISSSNVLGGVDAFTSWFKKCGAECNEAVRHAAFANGELRGLECTNNDKINGVIAKLPRKMVLGVQYDDGWDEKLATQLLKECRKGAQSEYYGYCSLLMRGVDFDSADPCPPNTAPDSLRHWTVAQKARLERSEAGKKMLKLQNRQEKKWRQLFADSSEAKNLFNYNQFAWAMEVVHSRAFKGDFGLLESQQEGGIPFRALASVLTPLAFAALGLNMIRNPNAQQGDSSLVFSVALAFVAFSPILLNALGDTLGDAKEDAVLLPLIDSANHMTRADSKIEFDPLSKSFTLSANKDCLVKEGDKTQLYITYGAKSDEEWLLNYGFLPKVPVEVEDGDEERDSFRSKLAAYFLQRNK